MTQRTTSARSSSPAHTSSAPRRSASSTRSSQAAAARPASKPAAAPAARPATGDRSTASPAEKPGPVDPGVKNLTQGLSQNFQGARQLQLQDGQSLRSGAHNDQVKDLQGLLNGQGGKLDVDGKMGANTVKAVRDFQKEHGLNPDGVVGPKTQAKLNELAGQANASGQGAAAPPAQAAPLAASPAPAGSGAPAPPGSPKPVGTSAGPTGQAPAPAAPPAGQGPKPAGQSAPPAGQASTPAGQASPPAAGAPVPAGQAPAPAGQASPPAAGAPAPAEQAAKPEAAPPQSSLDSFKQLAENRKGARVHSLEKLQGSEEVRFLNGRNGPSYMRTDLDVCTDGSGGSHGDANHRRDTAATYKNGKYLNADKTSYLVLPPSAFKQLGVSGAAVGDLAMIRYGDRTVPAIVGEVGPQGKTGEASYRAIQELTGQKKIDPNNDKLPGGVETIIFPGSGKGHQWTAENTTPDALRPLVDKLMQQQLAKQ